MALARLSYVFNRKTVKQGERFEVVVPSMAQDGYEWQLVDKSGLLRVTQERDIPPQPTSLPRAKMFTALASGKGTAEFDIRLVKEGVQKPKQAYPFKVIVK